jgi:hypothetical protein
MAIVELVVRKEKETRAAQPAEAKQEGGLAGIAKRITGGRKKKAAGAE